MPPDFQSLFPRLPLDRRARRLQLIHPDQRFLAVISFADTTGLGPLGHRLEDYLSASEIDRGRAFPFAPRRENFFLGQLAAKTALAAWLSEADPTKIALSHGVFGQPLVHYPTKPGSDCSLSHSGGFAAAIAFPREHPLAIDVEMVDSDRAETAQNELRLSPEERQWLQSSGVGEAAGWVMLWTLREALGKALRTGLTCPMELLGAAQIKPLAEGIWESRYRNFHQYKCRSWIQPSRLLSITLPIATELALWRD